MDELIVVRHAQSTGNAATEESRKGNHALFTHELHRQKSRLWPLTEAGVSQAKLTGEYIQTNIAQVFNQYISSPFVRTRETATALGFRDCVWEYEDQLIERDWGGVENLTYPERLAVFKKLNIPLPENSMDWKPPHGESMVSVVERVKFFLLKLQEQNRQGRILIVSHGGPIQALRVILNSITPETYANFIGGDNHIRNCQIFHYYGRKQNKESQPRYSFERTTYIQPNEVWVEATRKIS